MRSACNCPPSCVQHHIHLVTSPLDYPPSPLDTNQVRVMVGLVLSSARPSWSRTNLPPFPSRIRACHLASLDYTIIIPHFCGFVKGFFKISLKIFQGRFTAHPLAFGRGKTYYTSCPLTLLLYHILLQKSINKLYLICK